MQNGYLRSLGWFPPSEARDEMVKELRVEGNHETPAYHQWYILNNEGPAADFPLP